MTADSFFSELLSARADRAGIAISAETRRQLWDYWRFLTQWNSTINLTALPLDPPTAQSIDRLLVEPISAARWAGAFSGHWIDVGSGGGSPAIPFKLVQPGAQLTMVESRTRKAAYIREAVRALGLTSTSVVEDRFESFGRSLAPGTVDLITVRAVRLDDEMFSAMHRVLGAGGRVFLFQASSAVTDVPSSFRRIKDVPLGTEKGDQLSIIEPMFHVEQSD